MAATVEEITVSVNHVADRALETRRLAADSGQMAKAGEQVIGQTASNILDISHAVRGAAERIHDLEKHSSQIASVVQVIKDIADQTNLLALNADQQPRPASGGVSPSPTGPQAGRTHLGIDDRNRAHDRAMNSTPIPSPAWKESQKWPRRGKAGGH
jgi:hypothetical protein